MDVTERIDCFNIDNRLISQTGINGLAELSTQQLEGHEKLHSDNHKEVISMSHLQI